MLALLAALPKTSAAQEATPSNGMPEGTAFFPLISVPVPDMPPAPVNVVLSRFTLEPGTGVPEASSPYSRIDFVETGTLICPGGEGRSLITAAGAMPVPAGDVTANAGEAVFVPANAPDGARNDGTEPLSILLIEFVPGDEMGTPTT